MVIDLVFCLGIDSTVNHLLQVHSLYLQTGLARFYKSREHVTLSYYYLVVEMDSSTTRTEYIMCMDTAFQID
jgi:hypothetical protein